MVYRQSFFLIGNLTLRLINVNNNYFAQMHFVYVAQELKIDNRVDILLNLYNSIIDEK